MRKCFLIISLIALLLPGIAFPQNPGTSCGQKEVTDRLFINNPHLKVFQQQIEKQLQVHAQKVKQGLEQPYQPNAIVTLPVVVHIIHNNGTENISDAQVFTAIQHLNEAFGNTGYYDPSDGVNTQIQFCLAQRDPNNNPTNGIDRVVSSLTVMDGWNNGAQDIAVKNLSRWDPRCYINIWIVREIIGPVAGYAYLPSAHGMNIDGIVGEAAYFGSSNANDVLIIHEMGHYLGLYHTFQGGCTNNDCTKDGDQVCDTPPDQSTAGISCNSTANSCSTDALSGFSSDVNDLHTDYLDYGNWNCMKVFTQGQATRMNWMIENVRQSLLACKSCLSPCPTPVIANFSSSGNDISVGTAVNFTNSSVNASGYKWYINNTLQTTTTNFSYTFNTIGTYIIKLWALTNNPLCDSAVRYDTVIVNCPVTASFTPGTQMVPINTNINFTNTSTGATTYQWLINGVSQSAALNYPHLFASVGYYEIKLRAKVGLCYDSATAIITVIDTTSQPPADSCKNYTFQRTIGTNGDDIAFDFKCEYDSYFIAGKTLQPRGDFDGLLMRLNAKGEIMWSKTWGDANNEELNYVTKTTDGNFVFAGMNKLPGYFGEKLFFIKTDPLGNELYKRIYRVPFPLINISGITATSDGGFAICGLAVGSNTFVLFIAKVAADGQLQWSTNNQINVSRPGGIIQINDTLVVSVFYDPDMFTHISYLARVNINTGTVIDAKTYSTPGPLEFGEINWNNNSIEITGKTGAPHFTPSHQFKLELASNGDLKQAWRLNNADSMVEKNYLMSQDGKVFAQGATENPGSLSLIKTNSSLNWNSKVLTTGLPKFIRVKNMENDGVTAIGNTAVTNASGQDIYLLKVSSTGSAGKCEKTEIPTTLSSLGITITPTFISGAIVNPVEENTQISLQNKLLENKLICLDSTSCTIPAVDSCGRSTFQKLYTSQHGLELSTMNPTRDGGTIHAGLQRRTDYPQINALVTKLGKRGNVVWSTAVTNYFSSQFFQARETRDGGFIAVGQVKERDSEQERLLLVKFTASGAISWLRTYRSATGDCVGYDVIDLTTDQFAVVGNKLIGLNAYGLLLIVDETGNINLSKLYRAQTQTYFHSIVQSADTLAIGGTYNTSSNHVGTVLTVNVWTGAVIKSVAFRLDNRGNFRNIIYKEPYGYFLSTFITNFQDWTNKNNGVMRLNHNLQLIDAYRKDQPDETQWSISIPMHDTGYVIPTTTNNGFTLMGVGYDNHPTLLANIYGTSVGKTQPVNPIALDDGYYLAGAKYSNAPQGKINFLLTKTDRVGQTPDCDATPPMQSTTLVSANISPLQWNDISDFVDNPGDEFTYYSEPVPITISTLCDRCDSIITPPDTCGNITFQKKIGGPGVDHAFDIKALANNEYLIAGSTTSTPGTGNNDEALFIKLNKKGNILWQKSISGARKDQYTKIVVNAAGEYLVFGKTESQHNTNGSMLLTKFDVNGTILWSKEYNFTNASLTGFENVAGAIELPNGDIAFCGNASGINTEVGQPLPATFNIIGVLSNTGTLRWVKRLREYYIESGGAVTGIIEMNNSLFITATYGIMKMNVADGSLVGFHKKFQNLGSFNSIEPYGSQMIVYSNTHQIVLDQNLNLVSAYILSLNEPGTFLSSNGFSSENGSAIQGGASTNNIKSVFLSRFNSAGNNQWTYKYPHPSSEYRALSGSRRTTDNGIASIGDMYNKRSDDLNDPTDIFILRTDSAGRIPDCPRASINITPQPVQGNFIELHARNYPITTQIFDLTLQAQNPQLTAQSLCATEDCSTLILSSKDTVCSFSDTVQIKAYKDSACDAFTEWIVDTTATRIISQNDSLLTLQFKKAGVFTIYARLTGGCRLLQDNVTLTVFNSPDSVNLGPDIQLCKISTYTFKAGAGFKSYKWQDGSSDSSLTIYYPGVYHVTAEDYCGNLYRDTVVVSQSPDIPFDLGPDLKKCNNDTLTITAPAGFNKYYWSPGYRVDSLYSRIIKVSPDKDTTYTVIAERAPGCLVTDSIRVTVNHSIPLHLGNDTSFCQNDSITISATAGFNSYQWNTGANTQSIRVRLAGQYHVKATDSNGCVSRDSLEILPLFTLPAVNIGADFSVCRNTIHEFDAGNFTTYLWQDGSVNRKFNTSQTGTYWVRVSNANGCVNQDTATIIGYLESPQNFLDSSADICVGQLLEIKAEVGFSRYRWFNNSSTSAINITAPGIYWIEVTNAEGCTSRDSISVKAKDCLKGVFFPNAFTPSNGGKNNFFRPVVYGQLESFYLIVYNRFGQKVFETRDAYKGWDGKINGLMQGTNTFAWSAIYKFSGANEKQQTAKGTVTLVR